MKALILGGARSGKSALAEATAAASGLTVVYLATAERGDEEMRARIAHHRERRPSHWRLRECPLALTDTLAEEAAPGRCLLVDCLTLWLSNWLAHDEAAIEAQTARLVECLPRLPGDIILVSNEVGQGIVPMNALARRFRDEAGRLHQAVAAVSDKVTLVVAGLPLVVKGG